VAGRHRKKKFWGAIPRWLIVLAVGALGLTLIIITHVYEWEWDYGILPEIGIAFLIASLLAGAQVVETQSCSKPP
jgi:hypothetical protein